MTDREQAERALAFVVHAIRPDWDEPGILAAIRKAKSEAKVGMRTEVEALIVSGPDATLGQVRAAEGDLHAAGRVTGSITYAEAPEFAVTQVRPIPLAPPA